MLNKMLPRRDRHATLASGLRRSGQKQRRKSLLRREWIPEDLEQGRPATSAAGESTGVAVEPDQSPFSGHDQTCVEELHTETDCTRSGDIKEREQASEKVSALDESGTKSGLCGN